MLFNSIAFGIFMTVVFCLYWALPHRFRWPLLLAASYYFYMSWNAKYIVLIAGVTLVSWLAALGLDRPGLPRAARRALLAAAAAASLGVLFFFKYFNFAAGSLAALAARLALPLHPATLNVVLPVGISFYTFQTLSYVADVYRGRCRAERHLGLYATFISFFPQLVAGPIERTENLLPQLRSPRTFSYEKATWGLKLMAWGFFKKLAIADVVAPYVDAVYADVYAHVGFDLLVAVFFFTVQIYCDFSGYSDIARGAAALLGIDLMENFKSPYFSTSIRQFWSRWHISLSTWFRDYVYIPLGGNRCPRLRRAFNLMVTFLVSGLWHGASWTFVLWGGMHGAAQLIEDSVGWGRRRKPRRWYSCLLAGALCFGFCCVTWVFFRAGSFAEACYVLAHMLDNITDPGFYFHYIFLDLPKLDFALIMGTVGILAAYDFAAQKRDVIAWLSARKAPVRWAAYLLLVWLILMRMPTSAGSAFLYFQF